MGEFLTANDRKLQDILFVKDAKFIVPKYQRPYTWGGNNTDQLWSDVFKEECPFLGTFIFTKEGNEKTNDRIEIIDGQQRLLTITILMAALCSVANEIKDEKLADEIYEDTIVVRSRSGELTNRIECGESLKKFFEKYIQSNKGWKEIEKIDLEKLSPEETLVFKNYNSLKNEIVEHLKTITERDAKRKFIRDSWIKIAGLTVIRIVVNDEDEAYSIFETVNARGEDLSVADLLKNLIFKKIKSKNGSLDQAKEQWKKIQANISDAEAETTKFIRKFWLSKVIFLGEKKLYKAIRTNTPDYSELLNDLEKASEQYKLLLVPEKEKLKDLFGPDGIKIFDSLIGIEAMEVSQCYTLFLALLRNAEKIKFDVSYYFKVVEDFTFCYSSVCQLPTNKVEKLYSKVAIGIEKACGEKNEKNVLKNTQTVLNQFVSELEELRPKYSAFEESFLEINYKKTEAKRIKYILSKIEQKLELNGEGFNSDLVNIEHVLPQEPEKWGYDKKEVKDFVDNIGNLTLINKVKNSKMQNETLDKKMEILEASKMEITKKLVNQFHEDPAPWDKKWTREKIKQKAKEYSQIAYNDVWNYKKG